ncbi:MAG TPA: hypothetical protein VGH27_03505 [Streptosporangiaceae bacterium]
MTIHIPATGCTTAFFRAQVPRTLNLSGQNIGDGPATITVTLALINKAPDGLSPAEFEQALTYVQTELKTREAAANQKIGIERQKFISEILQVLETRNHALRAFRKVTDNLRIPVSAQNRSTESIQLNPRKLTVQQLTEALASGSPEWHLDERIAEDVLSTIMSFTSALERLVSTANKLAGEDEETIRDLLLFILNANYRGSATGETFVGQGKTDILLRWEDRDAFIGECKFWPGAANFRKAITQLLDRYTVWRDTRVALILFIRDRADITAIIEKANDCITTHERLVQSLTPREPLKRRDHLLRATTDRQQLVRLSLIPVVIPKPDQIREAPSDQRQAD